MIDLTMWTKNGAATLQPVLNQINQVIPKETVNHRFIVDDCSTDRTREIAKDCGWDVLRNEGKGISDGANTALNHIETEWFCSFEQDILLTPDWFRKMQKLASSSAAVASGIRFNNQPENVRLLQAYALNKYRKTKGLSELFFGRTLDNTFWNTKTLYDLGGFPRVKGNAGVDTVLAWKYKQAKLPWLIDYSCVSTHIRGGGLRQELEHQVWYGKTMREIWRILESNGANPKDSPVNSKPKLIARLPIYPLRGLQIALTERCPSIFYTYPLMRLSYVYGVMQSG